MSLSGKTVLVTGATGFLGGVVARRAAVEGAHVRALVRSPEKADYIRDQANIEIVKGNITNPAQVREAVQGCDIVLHIAVSYGNWTAQHHVNVEGTRIVMQAAADAGVRRFVHCSTIAVYGYTRARLMTESDLLISSMDDPYNVTKIKAEDAVHEIGVARGLSYTIIRPGMIYGPRSGMWTDFAFKFAQMKPLLWVGDGSGSMFPIHVEDVADLIALVAIHPAAHNEIFNCVGQVTWRKYLMQHAQLVDNNTFIGVPVPLVYMAARLISLIGRGAVRSVYEQAHAITRHATIDMRKARDLLGWQPKYTLEQGMETVIPYLREKGWLN